MPWSEGKMNDRLEMVNKRKAGWTKAELAEYFRVTWRTIHKWVSRFEKEGFAGLEDRSRRPHTSPTRTSEEKAKALIKLKKKYRWGPKKLVDLLPEAMTMAPSTAGGILKRAGHVRPHRRRRRLVAGEPSSKLVVGPGMMTADYKGQFKMSNGEWCYPLTICDRASRYILAIDAHPGTRGEFAQPVFNRVFREYGLPDQILTDNGAPFSNPLALGGLSELSRDWIKLGIEVRRIDPGKPQQNGRHERMHLSMLDTATTPAADLGAQQRRFNRFRDLFNNVRPHDALGRRTTPSMVWQPYRREMPRRLPRIEYGDADMAVRAVRSNGQIKWRGEMIFVSEVLIGERVAFRQVGDSEWNLYFGPVLLAKWDDRKRVLCGFKKRTKKHGRKGIIKEEKPV